MSDGRRRRKAKQERRDARRSRPREAEEAPLVDEVRAALATGQPIDLLGLVSTLIEATKPAPLTFVADGSERESVDLGTMIGSFAGHPIPETTALLAVLAEFLDDERCRREVAARRDALPQWIEELGSVDVYRAVRMTDGDGEGDEIILGVRLAGAGELTCCVLIDHTKGSEVKDAFFVPNTIDNVVSVAEQQNTDADISFGDMPLADARAMIEHGIAQNVFPAESDSWPASRPLVQWVARQLP
ncbi:hypothetical protein [Mycobacterium sp. 236(2023)]|uniref:hypothetical protein n=1 Tax=Mycobacterium sp. 236(2023) TaxID=3038163 RepID=UPI0024153864|nr:hypothetical protein [Mycobacterium sp. 236(2023)]MDG4663718.1 hypothetical protein [Mycobacterium sp. 236(2023)]